MICVICYKCIKRRG